MIYRITTPNGETITVDTAKSQLRWKDREDFNGQNYIHRSTGDQWVTQTLYLSAKGRYYIVQTSAWQGSSDKVWLASPQEAAAWLALNEYDLPADLLPYDPTE